jgi:hypothetical protein
MQNAKILDKTSLLTIVLVASSIVTFCLIKSITLKRQYKTLITYHESLTNDFVEIKHLYDAYIKLNTINIFNSKVLPNQITDSQKGEIVFVYTDSCCSSCVLAEMERIEFLNRGSINKINKVYISASRNQIFSYDYLVKPSNINKDILLIKYPFYCIILPDGTIVNPLIPQNIDVLIINDKIKVLQIVGNSFNFDKPI